jgi:hypothetical protein
MCSRIGRIMKPKFSLWVEEKLINGRIDMMGLDTDAFYYNTGGRIKDIFKPAHIGSYALNIANKTRYKSP